MVVDPSEEIAGGGNTPHACIGSARRMLGSHQQSKYEVLQEAVANHGPEVCSCHSLSCLGSHHHTQQACTQLVVKKLPSATGLVVHPCCFIYEVHAHRRLCQGQVDDICLLLEGWGANGVHACVLKFTCQFASCSCVLLLVLLLVQALWHLRVTNSTSTGWFADNSGGRDWVCQGGGGHQRHCPERRCCGGHRTRHQSAALAGEPCAEQFAGRQADNGDCRLCSKVRLVIT